MNYDVFYEAFYYASRPQGGADITSVTPGFPKNMQAQLVNFMCSVQSAGEHCEERLLYCAPLQRFCKIFISRDVTRPRDFFYHTVLVDEKQFAAANINENDAAINLFTSLLVAKSRERGLQKPEILPTEKATLQYVHTQHIGKTLTADPAHLAKIVSLAFRPFFTRKPSFFRFAGTAVDNCVHPLTAEAGAFVLLLLPDLFLPSVRMRFAADPATADSAFDCNYCFISAACPADYDFTAPTAVTEEEDPLGIFTAMGMYIVQNGMDAYRANILPVVQTWALVCGQRNQVSADLLYLMLRSVKNLQLPERQLTQALPQDLFSTMDAAWFEMSAPALIRNLQFITRPAVASSMEANPLFNCPVSRLSEKAVQSFFLLYAAACSSCDYATKVRKLTALYNRFAADKKGLQLIATIKAGMNLTLYLPSKPTPANVFEGVLSLQRYSPDYAAQVAVAAVEGYKKEKDANWMGCLNSMFEAPETKEAVTEVMEEHCEELLMQVPDCNTLAWLCSVCKKRICQEVGLCDRIIAVLKEKKITYDEMVFCVKTAGLPETVIPKWPTVEPLGEQYNTFAKLAEISFPVSATEAAKKRIAVLDRLCELLEGDCTWQDFSVHVPEILRITKFKPTMPVQPKIEKLMFRQLAVLATDVLGEQGGRIAYAELLISLRKEFCLCLYPFTGAAAGVFDENKGKMSNVKKTLLRFLPLVPLCLVSLLAVWILFVVIPVSMPTNILTTAIPAVFASIGGILILLQVLLLRRNVTADYILPAAVVMLVTALLRLCC